MTVTAIARLKITLDNVEPAVERRVEVPLKIRLDRLHLVFQAALGWSNSHLYEIRAGGVGWGMVDPDWADGPMDASKSRLLDVLEDMGVKTLKYLYDFGDAWEHTVKIERIADALPGLSYPVLIDAKGRCPPEDVGGPPGYGELLDVLANPKHKRHAEMTEWHGTPFNPRDAGTQNLADAVDALARKWSRKPKVAPKIKPKIKTERS
jgi:hypothetical protein